MAEAQANKTFTDGLAFDANPVNSNFKALKDFVNTSVVLVDGTKNMSGNLDVGGNKITNLGAPTEDSHLATRDYFDAIVVFPQNTYSCPAETPIYGGNYSGTQYYEGRCRGMVAVDDSALDITLTPGAGTSFTGTAAYFTFNETGQYFVEWRFDDAVPADTIYWGSVVTFNSAGSFGQSNNGTNFTFVNAGSDATFVFEGAYSTNGTRTGAKMHGFIDVNTAGAQLTAEPQTTTTNTYPSRQYTSSVKIIKIGEI